MQEQEAELIGMHVGDGTLYRTNSGSLVWEIRGSVDEKEFYAYIAHLIKNVFNVEVKPKYRGINSYGIQTSNKKITNFFVQKGFRPGSKVYTVGIPEYIKNGCIEIKMAFVKGLFDTDGCVWFCKNNTKYSYYPKIEFSFASQNLLNDLFNVLENMNFRVHRWQNIRKDGISFKICLAGFKNLTKWMKEIKPANSKHIDRVEKGLLNKNKIKLKSVSKNV
ncbi:MAG: LAGLIDADG family homing endonuclease [Nanoarchaeota archaeon]